jgi:hypothetical protein
MKDLLVVVLVYSRSYWDEFHVNNSDELKNSSSITLPFDLSPVAISSFLVKMAISRWPIVASLADHTENTMFHRLL